MVRKKAQGVQVQKRRKIKKIVLVMPPSPIQIDLCCAGYEPVKRPQYEMMMTAGLLRTKYDVSILDAKADDLTEQETFRKISNSGADAVVVWSTQSFYLKDIKILKHAKSRGIVTCFIMNDPIYLKMISQENPFIDFNIRHDRPFVLMDIFDNLNKKGNADDVKGMVFRKGDQAIDNGKAPFNLYDYKKLPMPAYDMVDFSKYDKDHLNIFTSFGCPYPCTFCVWGKSGFRSRDLNLIPEELKLLISKGYKHITLLDIDFTCERERVMEFCDILIKHGINKKVSWSCDARVDQVDLELLNKMAEAGCNRIYYGVEHIEPKILKFIRKQHTYDQVVAAIKNTKKAGIKVVYPFMIGYPGESWKSIMKLAWFLIKTRPDQYSITFPVPNEGTELYNQSVRNNWLTVPDRPENFAIYRTLKPVMVIPPMTEKKLLFYRKFLMIVPRMNPVMLYKSLKDAYVRGGMVKLKQVFGIIYRIVFDKPDEFITGADGPVKEKSTVLEKNFPVYAK